MFTHRGFVWIFRASLFVALLSAVVTVIYFTPIPDLAFVNCDRPCHELDWPMICRYKLTLELHQVMGGWCGDCPVNMTDCVQPGCIIGDGKTRRVMAVNKMLPGPSIQVCEKDILVVDVINKMAGQSVAVHWRGQHQKESPHMDGVPMVTQCPISSYTTFQYKFRAAQPGTHLWQAHTGNELIDGIFGSLIVRRPDKLEQHRSLYDLDDPHHVIILNEWGSTQPVAPNNKVESKILVNGIAYSSNALVPQITVTGDMRHRIRLAHAGGGQGCPLYLTVEHHSLLVIYLDGKPIIPKEVSTLKIAQGERWDFVLTADQPPNSYWLKVTSNCTDSVGIAKINYSNKKDKTEEEMIETPEEQETYPEVKVLSTMLEEKCHDQDSQMVCLPHIGSLNKMPSSLAEDVDKRIYLPFDYVYRGSKISGLGDVTPRVNNITFIFPSSPILSQRYDLNSDMICNGDSKPKRCDNSQICECVHVIDIPLNSRVEVVLIDKGKEPFFEHVFHIHGYSAYVVGIAEKVRHLPIETLKVMDSRGLLMHRNLKNPIQKDTVSIPKGGAVALRFVADNPGYWLLHDQSSSQWASGLDVLFKVGEFRDLPSAPSNFPQCGSWVGPDFFLI